MEPKKSDEQEPGAERDIENEWLGDHPELPMARLSEGAHHASDWTAVLGHLGGSSPGSEENQQLFEKFASVHFPVSRDDVLRSLPASAEFRARGIAVDLREAIADSRTQVFRSLSDLIDAVKDEIRRSEKRLQHPA
jgi:hypothetical protein